MADEATAAASRKDDTEALPTAHAGPAAHAGHEPMHIGPYRILGVIGRGGMGTIYRAEPAVSCPVPMGRVVALKMLRRLADRGERLRFAREVSYLQALRHKGIVRVLDNGEHQGQPYLVMPLVEGKPLDELIAKSPRLAEDRVVDIMIQALEALHVAHLAGILHRDIKPSNVMLTPDGTVKLLDFGLAQRMDGSSKLTVTGTVIGTPAYMSPEQAAGDRHELSRRSDVYSVGACLYEMLTGQQPYVADNSVAVLRRIIEEPLLLPSVLRPGLARDLETVVLKAMAKDARDRYPSAEAMAEDLRRLARGHRVRARRPSVMLAYARTLWMRRKAVMGIGLVLFLVGAVFALALRQNIRHGEQLRAEAEKAKQSELIDSAWVVEWHADGPLEQAPDITLVAHEPAGKAAKLATLPPVLGPVRLSLTVQPHEPRWAVQVMLSDRDVGRGYLLRLNGSEDGVTATLLREEKVVAERDLGRIARNAKLAIHLERVDETLSASVNATAWSFFDLTPIEGPDAEGTYLVFTPGETSITDVTVERQRGGLYVNALAAADLHRQDGRFHSAIREYEKFLHDYPDRPEARDARYRIALCLEQLGEQEKLGEDIPKALDAFAAIIRDYHNEPRYVLAATFRAWSLALRLGHYDDAEQYLEAIRGESSLSSLLTSVPQETLLQLVLDYRDRGDRVADTDPRRALRLDDTCAELAQHLGLRDYVASTTLAGGDLAVSLGDVDSALAHYTRIGDDLTLDPHNRNKAVLKQAEAWRLKDRFDRARAAYQLAVESGDAVENLNQWARLWLGDLFIDMGEATQARECWRQSYEDESLPGQLMRHLLDDSQPIPVLTDGWYANDVAYFNARLALLQRHDQAYVARLGEVARKGPARDWPTALALHVLLTLPEASQNSDAPEEPPPVPGTPASPGVPLRE